ncbi:hypothetical protein [Paenibacillus sp. P22]|uniref:hypothetical protein n=1 Tax=Paenibacillus sp. P22 TaxID=483908 RepID=UPI00038FD6D2|nr:hypothetical protein [Paenibacillus sp. P22]
MPLVERVQPQRVIFRIIPHHTVLNSASRNFQRSLYELFSVRHAPERRGLHVVLRPAPDFWWITKLATDSIEYFVAMPAEFADAFRTKFRNHEQWRKSTLELAPDFEMPPEDNTELYAIKYRRHDMFSLDFRYNEQATPVRDLVGVTRELAPGESVALFIRQETVGRARWKKLADYAWQTWDKGGVPYRAGFDPLRMLRTVASAAVHIAFEVKTLADDLLAGIERTFYAGSSAPKTKAARPTLPNADRAELLVNGDLSALTKNKRNLPVFKTSIRYAVTSADEVRRGMLARSVANAYGELAGDNRLESVRVNIRGKQALNDLRGWRLPEMTAQMMSVDELGKLTQLPTADIQAEFADLMRSNRRVETELPRVFLDDSGILAGTTTDRGATHNVHIPTKDADFLFTPRIINGSPRMGKDQHAINLIVEAKCKHGIGAVIIDVIDERNGHRGMSDAVRDHLAPADVIDIDLGDTEHPVYLGLDSIMRNLTDKRIAADRIAEEITSFLLSDGDAEHLQTADYLREAAKITGGDIGGIKRMFTDDAYRGRMIAKNEALFDVDIWRDYTKMSENMRAQKYAPVARRIGQIMGSEFLRPLFCQAPDPRIDLFRWISEGKVVLFRVPARQISERAVEIIAYWLTLNVFLAKVALGGRGAGTYLVLNEPHQFLSAGLVHFMERMLSEGPKYRLAPIIIFHHFAQFRKYPGFVDMMMAASANWHIFKNTNEGVYSRLMPYLSRTFADAQHAFEATKRFQYIGVWLNASGEYEAPFVADALPMVGDRYEARKAGAPLTRYGRPIAEVLAGIKAR